MNDSEYAIDCTGDCVTGDEVMFEKAIFSGGTFSGRFKKPAKFIGTEAITGRIIKDSYGKDKQQHTFTIELPDGDKIRIKGRNLYRNGTFRKPWKNEDERKLLLEDKHKRGDEARAQREERRSNNNLNESELWEVQF